MALGPLVMDTSVCLISRVALGNDLVDIAALGWKGSDRLGEVLPLVPVTFSFLEEEQQGRGIAPHVEEDAFRAIVLAMILKVVLKFLDQPRRVSSWSSCFR
jgi:hypothetical protein